MLGRRRRKQEVHNEQVAAQVDAVRRCLSKQIGGSLAVKYGADDARRLSQQVVGKLLGHPNSVNKSELVESEPVLVKQLAADIVSENQDIRDAVFIALRAMLEIASRKSNFDAERNILDSIQWLKQFGEIPPNSSAPEALNSLVQILCGPATDQTFPRD